MCFILLDNSTDEFLNFLNFIVPNGIAYAPVSEFTNIKIRRKTIYSKNTIICRRYLPDNGVVTPCSVQCSCFPKRYSLADYNKYFAILKTCLPSIRVHRSRVGPRFAERTIIFYSIQFACDFPN